MDKNYMVIFMLKIKKLFFVSLFLVAHTLMVNCKYNSKIYQDDSFNLLLQEIETLTEQDWIVFDVDGVLLIEQDAIFGVKAENKALWSQHFGDGTFFRSLTYEQQRYLYSIIRQQSICVPIENLAEFLIAMLKQNGIRSIALTSIKTGRNGIIEKTEDWRFEQLKKVGIDFSYSFTLEEPLVLSVFKDDFLIESHGSIFAKRGIVFAGEFNKGDVLKAFLKSIEWMPKRIIFIDDNRSWINSVDKMCEEFNIDFLGLHYIGAEKMSICANYDIAKFQVDYFFEHQSWLSDEQVKILF